MLSTKLFATFAAMAAIAIAMPAFANPVSYLTLRNGTTIDLDYLTVAGRGESHYNALQANAADALSAAARSTNKGTIGAIAITSTAVSTSFIHLRGNADPALVQNYIDSQDAVDRFGLTFKQYMDNVWYPAQMRALAIIHQ